METSEARVLPLDSITPYENNPRRIPEVAVERVRDSLERFGYRQPIVVDTDNVIIVGHTRYYALQKMEVQQVEVHVAELSDEQARAYRIKDNQAGGLSEWDHDLLRGELRNMDQELVESFFSDIKLDMELVESTKDTTEKDIEKAENSVLSPSVKTDPLPMTSVECPNCSETFEVKTETLPGLSHADHKELKNNGRTDE